MQDCSNSIANTVDLLQSCIKPSGIRYQGRGDVSSVYLVLNIRLTISLATHSDSMLSGRHSQVARLKFDHWFPIIFSMALIAILYRVFFWGWGVRSYVLLFIYPTVNTHAIHISLLHSSSDLPMTQISPCKHKHEFRNIVSNAYSYSVIHIQTR